MSTAFHTASLGALMRLLPLMLISPVGSGRLLGIVGVCEAAKGAREQTRRATILLESILSRENENEFPL